MLRPEYCSDDTLRVEIKDSRERSSVAQHLRDSGTWIECVEGMRSVVVQFDATAIGHAAANTLLNEQLASVRRVRRVESPVVEIPVCYGGEFGPELNSICEMMGMEADEVIALHSSRNHVVKLIGFTPGFAYVSGLKENLKVPRLTEPRQRVEPGSVGIAGGLTGLYALAGPGGWPLIGRTPKPLFLPDEAQPFLLRAGTRIRFVAIDEKSYRRMVTP